MDAGHGAGSLDADAVLAAIGAGPVAPEVARALHAFVEGLARVPLRARDGVAYRVPEGARDDVVQAVLLKVLERSPLPVVGQGAAACRAYLGTMLVHEWLGQHRRSSRSDGSDVLERVLADGRLDAATPVVETSVARAMLERLVAAAREARMARYRAELDRVWSQIVALCFEGASMGDLLARDEGVTGDTSLAERKRAVDRVLKSHQRVREEVLAAVETLYQRGQLSWVDAGRARAACRLLLRCQRRGPRGISGDEP
ncbi:MAG: hypothetical protein IT379_42195 [Deltaproteobacteria bacterium]|nr:hypothetical protein [Deltaproteobacteria bacterium]